MAWYHWLAGVLITIAGLIFIVTPILPIWLILLIFLLFGTGVLMLIFLPNKEEEYVDN